MTRQQEALLQIKQHPAYADFKHMLEETLDALHVTLESSVTTDAFRQTQGKCQAYRAMLDLFESELPLIEKISGENKQKE